MSLNLSYLVVYQKNYKTQYDLKIIVVLMYNNFLIGNIVIGKYWKYL